MVLALANRSSNADSSDCLLDHLPGSVSDQFVQTQTGFR
jgi:hypothetical protein